MTESPVDFLTRVLAEVEERARLAATIPHPWYHSMQQAIACTDTVKIDPAYQMLTYFNPATVLRQVAGARKLLLEHQDVNDGDCTTCVIGRWGYPVHGGCDTQRWPCPTLKIEAERWGWTGEG